MDPSQTQRISGAVSLPSETLVSEFAAVEVSKAGGPLPVIEGSEETPAEEQLLNTMSGLSADPAARMQFAFAAQQ